MADRDLDFDIDQTLKSARRVIFFQKFKVD